MVGGFTSFRNITTKMEDRVPTFDQPEIAADYEKLLPLELIRQHTKTDDTPRVTDAQLDLYRQAAFEACEQYTGLVWDRVFSVTENVDKPLHDRRGRRRTKFILRHAVFDDYLYMYGDGVLKPVRVDVEPGERTVYLPVVHEVMDANSCCNPCGMGGENWRIKVLYRTGQDPKRGAPAMLKLGCLKFIAWAIQNPGDVVMTVQNASRAQASGIVGTNNGAWASGAIEDWRVLVRDAI